MIFDLAVRIGAFPKDSKIKFFSDGNEDYSRILPDYFRTWRMKYGQLIKIRSGGRIVEKKKRIVYGTLDLKEIETTDVENFNSILRERVGRLVRKTKCYSKRKKRLVSAVQLFMFYWNFISNIRRDVSPAMMEGIIDRVLNWDWFLHQQLSKTN